MLADDRPVLADSAANSFWLLMLTLSRVLAGVLRLVLILLVSCCEPVLRIVLIPIAVLGILVSIVLEFSGAAPHLPFWSLMAFFAACGSVTLLCRALRGYLLR